MIVNLFVRAIVVAFAFFVAILGAATFFMAAALGIDRIIPDPAMDPAEYVLNVILFTGGVATLAGLFATMPVLLAIVAAETLRIRGFVIHLSAGAVAGAVSVFIWEDGTGRAGQPEYIIAMASGAVGALIYWALAGRNAGKWRERFSSPAPAEDGPQSRP